MIAMALHIAQLAVAQAEGQGADGPGGLLSTPLPVLMLMFGVIYFLMIRPAQKQRKAHANLLNQLKKDDEIVTNGGIYGRITALDEKVATLEVADKVRIRILRDRIAGRWSPSKAADHK